MITLADYLMGRDKVHPILPNIRANAVETVRRINLALIAAKSDGVDLSRMDQITGTLVASGYRPPAINDRTANAAVGSTHLTCEGGDVQDSVNRCLARWSLANTMFLSKIGLWLEDPRWTFSFKNDHWVHYQTRAPRSGRRVFIPNNKPPRGPALI